MKSISTCSAAPTAPFSNGVRHARMACAALGILVGFVTAAGATPHTQADLKAAQQVYESERAQCMTNMSVASQDACLKSAAAALAEARAGRLDTQDHPYSANELARCNALPENMRDDCVRRMHGEGIISGSVDGGGIFRELKTIDIRTVPAGN